MKLAYFFISWIKTTQIHYLQVRVIVIQNGKNTDLNTKKKKNQRFLWIHKKFSTPINTFLKLIFNNTLNPQWNKLFILATLHNTCIMYNLFEKAHRLAVRKLLKQIEKSIGKYLDRVYFHQINKNISTIKADKRKIVIKKKVKKSSWQRQTTIKKKKKFIINYKFNKNFY